MTLQSLLLLAEDYESSSAASSAGGASVVSILILVATWMIFKKAGEAGWKAIIPFYNTYTLFKLTWGNGWKFLLLLIPIYGIIVYIQTQIKLAHAFGKSTGFGWGLVLVSVVFMCILGFGDAQYQGIPA